MDGACAGAIKVLTDRKPWLSGVVCTTHSLDLLMEDICKLPWAKRTIAQTKKIVNFINNRHFSRALAAKHCSHVLLAPGNTIIMWNPGQMCVAASRPARVIVTVGDTTYS
jgi:hypothetical protein